MIAMVECTEDEYDALARQLHESIAGGQPVDLTAKALRLIAAPVSALEPTNVGDKHQHTHYANKPDLTDYQHDHSLFTPSQELAHLEAQHQPRVLPAFDAAGRRYNIDLDKHRRPKS